MSIKRRIIGVLIGMMLAVGIPHAQPDNLLTNAGFEGEYTEVEGFGTAAQGWMPWSIESAPTDAAPLYGAAMPDLPTRVLTGDNAQLISITLATTQAGVYQQADVPSAATATLTVNAYIWASADGLNTAASNAPDTVSVEVGIDPTGGIDAASPFIIWSEPLNTYDTYAPISVTATASDTLITAFVRITARVGVYAADVYLDDAALTITDVGFSQPAEPAATEDPTPVSADETPVITEQSTEEVPTATEEVPTITEQAPDPTAEPTQEATEAPTGTPIMPTEQPTETPTPEIESTPDPDTVSTVEGFLSQIEYVVQSGDSLYTIALVYSSDIDAIAKASGIDRETVLYPGDVLKVPIPVPLAVGAPEPLATPTPEPTEEPVTETSTEPSSTTAEQRYTVRRGDTLIAIARSFGVNEFELAAYNGFTVIDVIRVGQVLRIPPAAPTDTGASGEDSAAPQPTPTFRRYVIVPGDTLSRVAARFNTSVRAIVELNNITNPNRILYGQIIRIPNE